MHNSDSNEVIDRVRQALGRQGDRVAVPPPPPKIDESITRLAQMDVNLPELFEKRANELKMETQFVTLDDLAVELIEYLRSKSIKRVMVSVAPMFERMMLVRALNGAGFDAKWWSEVSLDESYDFDCAISDTTWAVAETGALVIKTTANHGRALTLVPMYHVAVVQPTDFVPDMLDLFDKLAREENAPYIVMISGPSKTADIEMNVVTGVHGPNVVKAYLLK